MSEQFTGEEKEDIFVVLKKDFNELYKMADSVLETRKGEGSEEYAIATALQEALDEAIDSNVDQLIFSEREVYCLSVLVQE